jgi:hypothetical protein
MEFVAPHGCCLPEALWAQIIAATVRKRDLHVWVFKQPVNDIVSENTDQAHISYNFPLFFIILF